MEDLTSNLPAVEQAPASSSINFIAMATFKALVGATSMDLKRNPNTGLLFVVDNNGNKYPATNKTTEHAELDPSLPVVWLVEDEDLAHACLINGTNSIATF